MKKTKVYITKTDADDIYRMTKGKKDVEDELHNF